ncbi:hypothetical protein [Mariniflexile sp. HMF6888]|uniref:hypothetical protein n=1 Tax=Mariniflexile sp. HMF6888 TaxID=3373086 RepID=UPI0037B6083B
MLLIALSCRVQAIPDGTYFKDINHLFDKYVDTWKGVYNNREYIFYITKHTDTYYKFSQDEILVRYLIANPDGSIVEDMRNIPDDDEELLISGDMFNKNANYYYMIYTGREAACGQSGTLVLRPKSATQICMSLI